MLCRSRDQSHSPKEDSKVRWNHLLTLFFLCVFYRGQWIYRVSIAEGRAEGLAREMGGKIFSFGSYRLGVHQAGADIDTLCIGPRHVTRGHFFTLMKVRRPVVQCLVTTPTFRFFACCGGAGRESSQKGPKKKKKGVLHDLFVFLPSFGATTFPFCTGYVAGDGRRGKPGGSA